MANTQPSQRLEKTLKPSQVWALALGCIVGWGCFVLPGDSFLPNSGPLATLIAFGVGALLLCFVAVVYSYMIEYCPVAGGEYAYAYIGYGPTAAFICGWALVLGYAVIICINISALGLLVRFLLPGVFDFGELYTIAGWKVYTGEVLLMCAATLFFGIMNYRGISIAGTLQVILAFALSVGILLLFFGSTSLETAQLSNLNPVFAEGRSPMTSILAIVAISPFLYVGFDTVPQVAEEFSFSPKKARNIMLAAIIWGGLLYAMVTFAVAIAIPYPEMLANMAALKARGETAWATGVVCEMAYGKFGAVVLATAVLGAVCTGINGFYVATTRLLLSMARGGIIPQWFADIHPRFHSPYKSIVFTICIVLLTPWCGRAVVGWIVDMSAVGTAIAYLYTCLAGYRLTSSRPVEQRGSKPLICIIGAAVSVLCIVLLLTPGSPALIGPAPRWIMLAWITLGVIFYFTKRAEWSRIPEEEMRERVLGSRDLPVFFKKDAA